MDPAQYQIKDKPERMLELKDEGNKHYIKGQFKEAMNCYKKGLEMAEAYFTHT